MNYEAAEIARVALFDLNKRILAHKATAPKITAPIAEYEAHIAGRNALDNEGKEAGFIRIFDGTFKLDLKRFKEE